MDELKHDDVSNRVEAMQNWTPLLLPWDQNEQEKNCYHFLTMLLKMMKKKFFAVLANKLGEFIPLIGGHQYSEPLISILTILASMEEPLVRDKAIDSLNKISLELSDEEINGIFLDIDTKFESR